MKTKHTPGPWNITNHNPPVIRASDAVQTVIAHVQYEKDATLIAAAPELLEALKKCATFIGGLENGCCNPVFDEAVNAIQKATGDI